MATRPAFFTGQFIDTTSGLPVVAAGYLLDTFDSGTVTPKVSYADEAQLTANANPIVLDAAGECSLFLGSGQYTLRLRTPAGAVVNTWDDVEGLPTAVATQFVPVAGGVSMTGQFELSANAVDALNPVPKQQLDTAIAAEATARTAAISTAQTTLQANIDAVAATAGATLGFTLATAGASSATRNVNLVAGTYTVIFYCSARVHDDSIGGAYTINVTQSASVGSTTINNTIPFFKGGSKGFGRYVHGVRVGVGSLVVATPGMFTMAINAAALNGAQEMEGSILRVEKTA